MKPNRIFKPDNFLKFLNYVGLPASALYGFSMLIWPFIEGCGDWKYVENVWDRWQSLNVAMLAFVSSITAFNISKYNAEKQQEREFLASKAFLPAALSDLVSYFKASAIVLKLGWDSELRTHPDISIPVLPHDYKTVFGECIKHAEPQVGDYLSSILVWLQVHDARLREYLHRNGNDISPDKLNLIIYFYRLGELQALTNKLFEFARNMSDFDTTPLNLEDFRNAYGNLNIWVDQIRINDFHDLMAYTKRTVERNTGQASETSPDEP